MLNSLELFGFKSFADRTRFEFDPGITGVVGPNGSGKSNVVDAIKWILGDQSAKSLRGKDMTDVIFNGAAGRKGSSFAEATLTIDNRHGLLPIESQEVQIGRRLWRNGDAEYLVNRNPARLKDVRELFMGTGGGTSAYCIIEQGRVDQILQANASSRRLIFEEAAGISRLKARKVEASRRLDRVDQNLLRLTDIVDEVEGQLNTVRGQAVKAARYREISEELRELWWGLAADEYRFYSGQLQSLAETTGIHTLKIDELNADLEVHTRQLSELEVEINQADDQLRVAEKESSSNRETIVGHQSTIRHQTGRVDELEGELRRLRYQRALANARAHEIVGEIEHVHLQLKKSQQEAIDRSAHQQQHQATIRELETKRDGDRQGTEKRRAELLDQTRKIAESENSVSALQAQRNSLLEESEVLTRRNQELEVLIEEIERAIDQQVDHVDSASAEANALEESLRQLTLDRESALTEQSQSRKSVAERRERRSAMQARKSVLEDLELRQEGLGIGVKDILNRALTESSKPWNQIHGSVADLLEVDMENAALLEVALGNRSQLIVIEELESLLEYINSGHCQVSGRVSFVRYQRELIGTPRSQNMVYGPPTVDGEWPSEWKQFELSAGKYSDLSQEPGVCGRADQLVRDCEALPHLPEQLLADTWIVESLAVALELAQSKGQDCCFVTLQGERLDADGTLIVGTLRCETALVSRKSELRRLKQDLTLLDRKIAAEEKEISDLSDSLSQNDVELKSGQQELNRLKQRLAEQTSALKEKNREAKQLSSEQESIDKKRSQLQERLDQADTQMIRAEQDCETAQGRMAELKEEIATIEKQLGETESQVAILKRENENSQLQLAKHEERLESLATALSRLNDDQKQRQQQQKQTEERYDSVLSQKQASELEILNSRSAMSELCVTAEAASDVVRELLRERNAIRQKRAILLEHETELRGKRRKLSDLMHKDELQSREIQHQLDALEKRIDEEYQVTLAEVVQSGASALERYYSEETDGDEVESDTGESFDDQLENNDADGIDTVEDDEVSEAGNEPAPVLKEVQKPTISPLDLDADEYEEIRSELNNRVSRLRRKLKHMGTVNTESLRSLDELEQRFGHLSAQLQDLIEAKSALEEIIRKINSECKRLFAETFETVRGNFQHLFRKAFGGGNGDVILEDTDDVLECGIDIVARPPGKELKSISLLSGGEKTLTAFALLLALFQSRPSPYCLLDEVDAALDEANVGRLVSLLEEFKDTTQFIIITHKKPTMTIADMIYGVTMEESGVSKRMSVRFENIGENGEFKGDDDGSASLANAA